MLRSECEALSELFRDVRGQRILNLCSSHYDFHAQYQPYYLWHIVKPLLDQKNVLVNLDLKEGTGVHIVGDCHDLHMIGTGSYDIVFFFNSIEHLWNPTRAVSEIHRVLKSEGTCYASAPATGYSYHEDPIDTMLRLSSVKDWREFFPESMWDVIYFKFLEEYRLVYHRMDSVTVIQLVKLNGETLYSN